MVTRTYGDVAVSVARVSGTSGMPVTDRRVMEQVNLAQEELMNEGEWPGVVDRWTIVSDGSGTLVLPSHLDRLMQITIAGVPQEIKAPWFSFVAYGPGIEDDVRVRNYVGPNAWGWCGSENILEVGEKPVKRDLGEGLWKLRVYADANTDEEAGAYLLAQGTDGSGNIIRTQLNDGSGTWIDGERIAISSGSGFAESVNDFQTLSVVTKPVTNGRVVLKSWNGETEEELSTYEYWETTPSYHHYFSPWLRDAQRWDCEGRRTVIARCRRRFVPVMGNSDKMIISNLPALREMVRAIWKRDAGAIDEYAALKTTAVDLMSKEAMAYRGKARVQPIVFQRGFMGGDVRYVR